MVVVRLVVVIARYWLLLSGCAARTRYAPPCYCPKMRASSAWLAAMRASRSWYPQKWGVAYQHATRSNWSYIFPADVGS